MDLTTVKKVLDHLPTSWVELTTHRLDIYDESQAKSQFLTQLQQLIAADDVSDASLEQLPTAYDYIRLGHQLSSVLELLLADINQVKAEQVISFTSKAMPILAVLRDNAIAGKQTHIYYTPNFGDSAPLSDQQRLQEIYGYRYQLHQVASIDKVAAHPNDTVLFVTQAGFDEPICNNSKVDACVNIHPNYGSVMVIYGEPDVAEHRVKAVQHVRRRESIAMSPRNCRSLLTEIVTKEAVPFADCDLKAKGLINKAVKDNTGSDYEPIIASSGLSIQYAMLMGLVEAGKTRHAGKSIELILPPNCYGGTNDQARRIADLIPGVEIVDLPVDSGKNLVDSLEVILNNAAASDSVPIVLAEIPTNPRVEVPDMSRLAQVLSEKRTTANGDDAVAPIFTVDQTFCPNVNLLGNDSILAQTQLVSFSSGSKFPSGGRCIAGYCAVNEAAASLATLIQAHLLLSDNAADVNQINTLAENMPSMAARIAKAYDNAVVMVKHIQSVLPKVKINFVCEELADQGFTPSVFSFDLPTKGDTPQQRETYQKELNEKLIHFMIERHPQDCKYCVSYGQLKGCYWTIPATSTQGTTKETDKDYVVRVALAPDVDVESLCQSFSDFCKQENVVE